MSNAQKVDDGVGLSDSLRPEHQSGRGPSALSLSGFGCLAVVADPSKRRCLGECWGRRLRTRGPQSRTRANAGVLESVGSADCEPEARIAGRLLGNAKAASGRVTLSFACAR